MRIVICGSMSASREMLDAKQSLEKLGYQVVLPEFTYDYAKLGSTDEMHIESALNKIKFDLIRGYYEKIKNSDAILVVNPERKGIPGYVGGNTLIEMAFAHVLNKAIFFLFPVPDMSYTDEIVAMHPIVVKELDEIQKIARNLKID